MHESLSTEQLGWVLGRSANSIRGDIKSGAIESTRLPRGFRIPKVEVLRLAARGLKRKEIGDQLSISENTVRHHLEHIYGKTGTRRQAELIRRLAHLVTNSK